MATPHLTAAQQEALHNLKIESLNEMQRSTIEAARSGENLILLSPTGTGKTLACLLPLMEMLAPPTPLLPSLPGEWQGVQALVVAPSRELAQQTAAVWRSMGSPWRVACCTGGRPAMEEHRLLRQTQPALVVGTPGRLNDHIEKGNIATASVRLLIIDEFDKSLELGFHDAMARLVESLPALERRILLSATDCEELPLFAGMERGVRRLAFLPGDDEAAPRLTTHVVHSPEKDKLNTLYRLLCTFTEGQALVFCNHRESVERVSAYLAEQQLPHGMYHGGMEQERRERALYKFRNGSCNVLISTDLAARGLDIPQVRNVVHYHLPPTREVCLHRNGRTARWQATGDSYLILSPQEQLPPYIAPGEAIDCPLPQRPRRPQPPRWVTLYVGRGKRDKISRSDIAGFLYKKGGLSREQVGNIDVLPHCAYVAVLREKSRQLLALVRNEKIKGIKTIVEEVRF